MNAEIKEKWVAALRSGKYEQGRGCLKDLRANTHCCLGVLAEVLEQALTSAKDFNPELYSNIRKLSGLNYADEKVCIRLNDDDYKTFSQIADYVEAQL